MFKNLWKSAWGNLLHDRLFSIINIVGLTVGLTSCMFIALYLNDELSYDSYHEKSDRTYRLWEILNLEGSGEESSSMQFPVGPAIANDYPQYIEESVRFFNFQRPVFTLQVEEIKYNQEDVFFVDSGVFRVFDWPLLSGDPQTIMGKPNAVVIDEDLAEKYFGDEDPLGKTILMEGGLPLEVGGVMKNIPAQSHFRPKALVSFITLRSFMGTNIAGNNWVWNPCWTYLLLKEGVSPEVVEAQSDLFVDKYFPDFLKGQTTYYLMPLEDIHLESHLEYEIRPNQHRSYLYILGGIGLIILLIAAVNYTNLATARAGRRAKEVGIRKTSGAHVGQLIIQFLFESFVSVLFSVILSLALVNILIGPFNKLASKEIDFSSLFTTDFVGFAILLVVVVTVLSGLYPAFYLSSFRPSQVLKGGTVQMNAKVSLRKVLVVFQFALASTLIIGTLMINRQFRFMQDKDPGFVEDEVVVVSMKTNLLPNFEALRNEFLDHPAVVSMTVMNDIIGEDHNVFEYNYEGMSPDEWKYMPTMIVDEHFVSTMGLEIVAGRDFNEDIASDDTSAVLVNETLVRELGWGTPQDALGKSMDTPRGNERVVGVLKDFNYVGLTEPIRPFVLDMIQTEGFWIQELAFRIGPGQEKEALAHLEGVWNTFAPQFPFEYFFLEDRLDSLYRGQDTLRLMVALFSLVAIIISCIGLFALTSLSVARRTKEIGIRKILGADSGVIAWLISKEVLVLICLAFIISIPVAYWGVERWLESFAFRIDFGWGTVLLAAGTSILVAMITISYHALTVSRSNPVKALRYE